MLLLLLLLSPPLPSSSPLPPPSLRGEAFDRRSRAAALTPADRKLFAISHACNGKYEICIKAAADIVGITLDWTAAGSWPHFSLAPLDFNCWCRLSYQLHLFSVKMFFMSAVFQSFQLFVNHPIMFFFLSFFFSSSSLAVVAVVCAFILHLSTRLLCSLLSRSVLYYYSFITTQFMISSLCCHFTPADERLPLDLSVMQKPRQVVWFHLVFMTNEM